MSFDVDVEREFGRRAIALKFTSDATVTMLMGPSGSGKSTVLNMIAGIRRPTRGRIAIGDSVLFDSDLGIDVPPQQRGCGYVFQDARLFPHMNVRDNLRYGRRRRGRPSLIAYDAIVELLYLRPLEARRPATLSGGEARRVAIGRTLLSNPRFLLLDEPLTSLDPERRDETLSMLERLRDSLAVPILYVTHHADEVTRIAGKVITVGN